WPRSANKPRSRRGSASLDVGPVATALKLKLMKYQLVLGSLLLVGTLAGPADHSTFAQWTTSVSSTSNYFSAGTLHIGGGLAAGTTLSMDHLIAGDNFDAQLDVDNNGSLPLTYALSTT